MPNTALQDLLTEARWTQDGLARQVNALAGEIGLTLRLDRRTVSHWLAGRRPRPPLPELIAEAFTRRLGRRLSAAGLGLAPASAADHPPNRPADPLRALEQLCALAESGRELDLGGSYRLAELASVRAWPGPDADGAAHHLGGHRRAPSGPRLEAAHVAAAESMVRLFADADSAFGGGHARTALARYLAYDLAPRLRAPAGRQLRAQMLGVATELTLLCGSMCCDDERHALAQRYYLAALELTVENRDPVGYALTLRALSAQAHSLGHRAQALRLAEAALTGVAGLGLEAGQEAQLRAQLAVASAAGGDGAAALDELGRARRLLEDAGSTGRYNRAAHADDEAAVRALLGDLPGGIRILSESVRRRPPRERRSRAITLAQLAELHLDQGQLDASIAACHAFIDDYPHLHSARARAALCTLVARLRPHSGHHAARQVLARAAAEALGSVR